MCLLRKKVGLGREMRKECGYIAIRTDTGIDGGTGFNTIYLKLLV